MTTQVKRLADYMVIVKVVHKEKVDCTQVQQQSSRDFKEEHHIVVVGKVVLTWTTSLVQAIFHNIVVQTGHNQVEVITQFVGNIIVEVVSLMLQESFEDSDTLQDFVHTTVTALHSSSMAH